MSKELDTREDILPRSGKVVVFRGMTGNEEDILTDKKLARNGKAMEKILLACTLTLDGDKPTETDIRKLKTPDRVYLLVKIRQLTYGDLIEEASVPCSNKGCGELITFNVDLSERPVKVADDTDEDKLYYAELPVTGAKVKFADSDGDDEAKLLKAEENELLTVAVMLRLREVIDGDGNIVHKNDYKRWLKGLPAMDRSHLRKEIESTQVGIDTAIELRCEECGTRTKLRVETLTNFFFPEM